MAKNSDKHKVVREVFNKIKKDDIKIKPKCYILACKLSWVFIAFIVFVFSVYLATISLNHLVLFKPFSVLKNNLFFIPAFYPFLVFGVSVALVYAASRFYRRSRSRCRHEEWALLGALLFLAFSVLIVSALSGIDKRVFEVTENSNLGKKVFVTSYNYWSIPEKGTLSGFVFKEVQPNKSYQIKDWRGNIWEVGIQNCSFENKNLFETQSELKMIGEKQNSRTFKAVNAWAWGY
ncbi:MAG: hypothetical protein R6V40_01185 [Candidatus Moraniibacteriota bacterium]